MARPGFLLPLLLLVPLAAAQTPAAPDPRLREARERIANEDWAGAIELLEARLAEGDDASACLLLARALDGRGDWEAALSVLELAAEDATVGAQAHHAALKLCARNELVEDALAHLELALEQGFQGPLLLLNDPDLASLRELDAFRALVPPLKPSSECFLERPRILHTFYGEAPGDVFGWIGRDLGDADGDGRSDLLISAPFKALDGPSAGRIYVYSGATGALLFTRDGSPGECLGIGIESAGDVNRDGHMDAIAGGIHNGLPNLPPGPGMAYVYSGKDGSTLLTLTRGVANDELGRKVSGGVDFDDDGHPDVLVGAPGTGPDGRAPGSAFLFSGKDGSLLCELRGEQPGDLFGASNAVWEGKGRKLLALGAGNGGEGDRGAVSVHEWRDGKPVPRFTIENDATGLALGGMFVAFVGDMTGDGISEVYASDWRNGANGSQSGRIYVHDGDTGARLFTLTGERAGIGFGTCTADVGDVTGDGLADLLVGAWQAADGAPGGGKSTLYAGGATAEALRVLATYTCSEPGETSGFDTTGVGDLDGDGGVDFLVTGGYSPVAGRRSGRCFVIAGPVSYGVSHFPPPAAGGGK